jgi:hypothetical protein
VTSRKGGAAAGSPPERRAAPQLLLLSLATLTAWGVGGADAPAVEAPISTARVVEPPLLPGPTPDLDLLFTAQVAGWVEPCG